jgi:hypothetical protein
MLNFNVQNTQLDHLRKRASCCFTNVPKTLRSFPSPASDVVRPTFRFHLKSCRWVHTGP